MALVGVAVIGGAGLGLDTYRGQNAKAALTHVTELVCNRVANADSAHYSDDEARKVMGLSYAQEQARQTSLDASRTSFSIEFTPTSTGSNVTVNGTTAVDATLTKLLGFSTMTPKASRLCTSTSNTTTSDPGCTVYDLIYTNTTELSANITNIVNGSTDYVASVIAADDTPKLRMTFGNRRGDPTVFLSSLAVTDRVVLQPFNMDGTIPQRCNPRVPPPPPPPTSPPPPPNSTCPETTLAALAAALGKDSTDDAVPNPTLAAMVSGSDLLTRTTTGVTIPVGITTDFDPRAWAASRIPQQIEYTVALAHLVAGLPRPTGQGLNRADTILDQGGRLRRIISQADAIWYVNGQCVYVISPILLDLTGKGEIETTGVSSERAIVPGRLGAQRKFDMLGNGRPLMTEWIVGNGQGLLVDNRDGMAAQDMNGRRLFGSVGGFENGYTSWPHSTRTATERSAVMS